MKRDENCSNTSANVLRNVPENSGRVSDVGVAFSMRNKWANANLRSNNGGEISEEGWGVGENVFICKV